MFGKPNKKMPSSSWMIPGGNREKRGVLMKMQRYPMKSAIKKNLGGPLSEVFFSNLSPSQKDSIGYTPKLQGPGANLWVSPSDILIGKIRLTPPFTIRARQALTHQKILEIGAQIEARYYERFEKAIEEIEARMKQEMQEKLDILIREALAKEREEQYLINRKLMDQSISDISEAYQRTMEEALAHQREECTRMMEEAVKKTEKEMEQEMCRAVNNRSDYLCRQYDFQLALRESSINEKYENRIKKLHQECAASMDKAQEQHAINLRRTIAKLEAEHTTDLLIQGAEKNKTYQGEVKDLESNFEKWFVQFFDTETVKRDFAIVELEDGIKTLKAKFEKERDRLREVFRHFQKFINFALKEKPGQAEFLLSLEKELMEEIPKESSEDDNVRMARMVTEYILKQVEETCENARAQKLPEEEDKRAGYTTTNFRGKIQKQKDANTNLRLVGETGTEIVTERHFIKKEAGSLKKLLRNNPSLRQIMH